MRSTEQKPFIIIITITMIPVAILAQACHFLSCTRHLHYMHTPKMPNSAAHKMAYPPAYTNAEWAASSWTGSGTDESEHTKQSECGCRDEQSWAWGGE